MKQDALTSPLRPAWRPGMPAVVHEPGEGGFTIARVGRVARGFAWVWNFDPMRGHWRQRRVALEVMTPAAKAFTSYLGRLEAAHPREDSHPQPKAGGK